VLAWLEARGSELACERLPGLPVRLRTSGGLADSSAQRLLELSGYRPDNYFVTMQIDLADWEDPGTATVARRPGPELVEAIRDAHNDAFRDHRNHSPISAAHWAHWTGSSTARPDLSRVVVEDDLVVAYLVGTRRSVRGRGLGRDVLVAGLRAAAGAGMRTSELEVDSTSPTGADRLYVSAGYRPVRVVSRYVRDLPAR
jgi:GNAT superfamily N-acetyltransferase